MDINYVYRLGEFEGSDLMELRAGSGRPAGKFVLEDSLYVLDLAFDFGLEGAFQAVEPRFDMFEDTVITKRQWREIMRLDLSEFTSEELTEELTKVRAAINDWIESAIPDGGEFLVIGV